MPSAMLLRVGFPADVEGEEAGRSTASPRRSEMIAAGEAGCGEPLTSSRPFQMMMGDATSPLSIGGGRDGDVGVVEDVVAGPITAARPPVVAEFTDMNVIETIDALLKLIDQRCPGLAGSTLSMV